MRSRPAVAVALVLVVLAACAGDVPVSTTGDAATVATSTTVPLAEAPAPPPVPAPTPPSTARPVSPPPNLVEPDAELPGGEDTSVESVVDGDTIVVAGGTRVRLIGVDTPETEDPRTSVQCFGREASAHTSSLVAPGTPVRLVYDVERFDRYGRTLAYVYRRSDGLFVNAALVAGGYALVATFPPNVAHVEELTALSREAREEGRGLWSACSGGPGPLTPTTVGPASGDASCDPSYPGVCIPSAPPDLDCGDVGERRFTVVPPDPHRFDGDGDGVGCES